MWRSACNSTGCLCSHWPHRVGERQRHTRHIFAQTSLQGSKLLQETAAWPELPLHEVVYGKTEAVRCRQHVNPLKRELQVPIAPPDWAAIYPDTARPLIVDVGCGSGRFLLALSRRFQQHNMLGLDIRNKLMERANEWAKLLDLHSSVHFMMANATVSLESMLATYPGPLSLVTIQFPDPHFKVRHKKRRVVQPQLVRAIARILPRGGRVFLQSDVEEAVAHMHHMFRQHAHAEFDVDLSGCLVSEDSLLQEVDSSSTTSRASIPETGNNITANELAGAAGSAGTGDAYSSSTDDDQPTALPSRIHCSDPPSAAEEAEAQPEHDRCSGPHAVTAAASSNAIKESEPDEGPDSRQTSKELIEWLLENPLGVPTEREIHTLQDGGPVFRSLFKRT